jgi:peptide-methionine (S)-S-oxide reductase
MTPGAVKVIVKSISVLVAVLVAGGVAGLGLNGMRPAQLGNDSTKVGSHPGGIRSGSPQPLKPTGKDELAAFSGGCFWGVEATFRHVKGVVATAVGYTGGKVDNPTYDMVCTHATGHAETVLVEFDPSVISYKDLVHDFWLAHQPTEVDRQGPDVGNNYRSAIWTFSSDQLKQAEASRDAQEAFEKVKFATQIAPIGTFWLAEDFHQQYDEKTGTNTCPPPRQIGG